MRTLHAYRWAAILGLAIVISALLTMVLAGGLALDATHPALSTLILALFAVNTGVLALSALTALIGVPKMGAEPDHTPEALPDRCAALWLVCGESPEPLAREVKRFADGLATTGQDKNCDIFVLSDTSGDAAREREKTALAPLSGRIIYRNRPAATGRKPGNLQDWLARWGREYDTMLVLDADSGFSVDRLARMRARMAGRPKLGLLQASIRMRPAPSRFGAMQRLSARLSGPVFARGLARLSGDCGNFWGHNALIRTRALAEVTPLPDLPGRPPFGGPVLSHDFIEAAFLRRAGWEVALCPDSRGSFEDTPETIAAHMRRDRRWAQGNLQHLRLIGARGLHPVSRLHLASGILSYLSAPIWLALILLTGSGAVHATVEVIWPLLGVLVLLLVPKLAGLLARRDALRYRGRRRILLRALWAELGLTTLFAPIGMIGRSRFIAAIARGNSVDWVPSGHSARPTLRPGQAELLAGLAVTSIVAVPQAGIAGLAPALLAALLVLPVTLPLISAPRLWRWFDAAQPRKKDMIAQYYDTSTRRFLALGRSGTALAIHRPLWGQGVQTHAEAAAHVNTLIASEAETALGHPPRRVVDLGCGVGGTLFHLGKIWPESELCGITISAEQVRLARAHALAREMDGRCLFLQSDFTLPMTLPRADLVVAVESHVHAPDAGIFLQAALRHLRPGGVLVLVDDMLAQPEASLDECQMDRLLQFCKGWRLGHVPDPAGLQQQARDLGLQPLSMRDLTPFLRLNRLRDRALRLVGPLAQRLGLAQIPLFGNMIGGNALTQGYRAGQMRYTLMVMRRSDQRSKQVLSPAGTGAVA